MKRIKCIFKKIVAIENLYIAAHKSALGKRYDKAVADFIFNLERNLLALRGNLLTKKYRHGGYRVFKIYEPKERLIAAVSFRDRIVHYAVYNTLEPILDKSFIFHSYACRKGKGAHRALDTAQAYLRVNKYCLHGDIRKYFYSVNHVVLKNILRRKIKDIDLMWLLDLIIDSANEISHKQGKGLPIGNLTSQVFANLYLNELDYFIKHNLKCKYYVRYMDDFLVFDNDKYFLKAIRVEIRNFLLNKLKLFLHEEKTKVYRTNSGIKFLGVRLYYRYRRLSNANVKRFKQRLKKFEYLYSHGKISREEMQVSISCWEAYAKHANTIRLRENLLINFSERLDVLDRVLF